MSLVVFRKALRFVNLSVDSSYKSCLALLVVLAWPGFWLGLRQGVIWFPTLSSILAHKSSLSIL